METPLRESPVLLHLVDEKTEANRSFLRSHRGAMLHSSRGGYLQSQAMLHYGPHIQ